jgi:copper resistance protein B
MTVQDVRRGPGPLRIAAALSMTVAALAMSAGPAAAQHAGHHVAPATQPPAPADPQVDHSTMDHSTMDHSTMDHSAMDHSTMDHSAMDHSAMDHSTMDHSTMDHSAMGHDAAPATQPPAPADPQVDHSAMDHATMDHSAMGHSTMDHTSVDHAAMGHGAAAHGGSDLPADAMPREPVPALTDADRRAAFPDVAGHAAHDKGIHWYVLGDRLETSDEGGGALAWDVTAWIGGDIDRLWLRSEGERSDGHTEAAGIELLYGRSVAPWWDVLVGIRHDVAPGASQDFLALGVAGLAPMKFEVSATAYLGQGGRTQARFEAEYELLLTNRLVLQPSLEATLVGRDDPGRALGSGLATVEAGLRLRYEITRRFAPYVGIARERAFGGTADYRRDLDEDVDDTRLVAGVRFWF